MSRLSKLERIELWQNRLKRFSLINQTVADFCSSEGVSVPSFYQWKRRLSPTTAKPKRSRNEPLNKISAFAEVRMASSILATASVQLPGGITIELGADPAASASIVQQVLNHSHDIANRNEAASC